MGADASPLGRLEGRRREGGVKGKELEKAREYYRGCHHMAIGP